VVAKLGAHGYESIEAEAIDDAKAVMEDRPDLAIVDERFVHALASCSVPLIALTQPGARSVVVASGACCAVEKPLREDELMRAVRWVEDVYARSPRA
jgi:hypothetical protein